MSKGFSLASIKKKKEWGTNEEFSRNFYKEIQEWRLKQEVNGKEVLCEGDKT